MALDPHTQRGWIIIASVISVFVAMGSVYVYLLGQPKPDPVTLCHPDHPPRTHTIILVDKTDPLPDAGERKLREMIMREKKSLPQFDKLSIYQIIGHTAAVATVFSLCNPGDRETASPFYENPRQVQMVFESQFEAPLEAALKSIRNAKTAEQSPIMEAIDAISHSDPPPPDGPNRRLIVISDMLQNVDGAFSHYKTHSNFQNFANRPYFQNMKTNLDGTDVFVHYIARYKQMRHQGTWHINFWKAYFRAVNARSVRIMPFFAIRLDGTIEVEIRDDRFHDILFPDVD